MMTAIALSKLSGKSVNAIKGVYYRKHGAGFDQFAVLPDDVIAHVNGGKSEPGQEKQTEPKKAIERKLKTKRAEPEPSEPKKQTEPTLYYPQTKVEQTEPEPEKKAIEPEPEKQPELNEPGQANQFDLGELLFFHPTAQFVYVVILLACGAYVFGSLAGKVFPDGLNTFTQAMFYAAGFLVEASGIMLAKSYKRKDKFDDANQVWVFLVVLFGLEVWVECSYMFADNPFTFGGLAVVILRPFGQLIYSGLYLNKSK